MRYTFVATGLLRHAEWQNHQTKLFIHLPRGDGSSSMGFALVTFGFCLAARGPCQRDWLRGERAPLSWQNGSRARQGRAGREMEGDSGELDFPVNQSLRMALGSLTSEPLASGGGQCLALVNLEGDPGFGVAARTVTVRVEDGLLIGSYHSVLSRFHPLSSRQIDQRNPRDLDGVQLISAVFSFIRDS